MSGRHLGSLGTDKGVLDITFDWFGRTLRVNPGAGELELTEFLIKAQGIEVPDVGAGLDKSVPAMEAIHDFLRAQVHPDDWKVFWDLAKTHRQSTADLMEVAMKIVEAVGGFPTGPSSDSSPGPSNTEPKSKDGSGSPARSVSTLALAQLSGRPDLQMAIVRRQEAAEV